MTDNPGWKRHGHALLWSLGAALTAAAPAYASWLLMTVASLYTAPSPFEARAKSDQARAGELAATLAPPAAPFAAPPMQQQQQQQEPRDAALSPQRQSAKDAPLSRDEVREIQKRLAGLGFDPGRLDGRAGLRTEDAARRYRLARSEADTGAVDRSLLEALRRDPAPPLPPAQAAPPHRPAAPANPILASIKTASDRLARWLNSIGR